MNSFSGAMQGVLQFFSDNPSILAAQIGMIALACIVVFLVLLATRDIMSRTDSLLIQIVCIVLVAALPVLGFFLYLLVRPSRTITEKKMQADLEELLRKVSMPPPAPPVVTKKVSMPSEKAEKPERVKKSA